MMAFGFGFGVSHTAMALPGKIARRVGFDTDGDSDIDDVLAFAILAELAALGEVSVKFITTCTDLTSSAPAFKALATYSSLDSVPVGARKTAMETPGATSLYTGAVRDAFRPGDTAANYPNAITVMRQALADTPDGAGFAILIVGTSENVADLINSPADGISPLTGIALMQAKGVTLHIMGGAFVDTSINENNIEFSLTAANVIASAPIPKVYDGAEMGATVNTRYPSTADLVKDPYQVAWKAYGVAQRPSWDLIAVIEAARGTAGGMWSYSAPGNVVFGVTPWNNFTANPSGTARYLIKSASDTTIANYLNALIDSAATRFDKQAVTPLTLTAHSFSQNTVANLQLTATQTFTATLVSGGASGFTIETGNVLRLPGKAYNAGGSNAYVAVVRYTDPAGNTIDQTITFNISQYSVESETASYLAAMTVQPDATRITLIDNLVKAAKTAGVWSKLDQLAILASHDAQAALVNAVNPSGAAFALAGTTSFTTDRGVQGDGTSGQITFPLLLVSGGQAVQNSVCLGAWCNLQGSGTGQQNHIGQPVSAFQNYIGAATSGTNEVFRLHDSVNGTARAGAGRVGHRTACRGSSGVKRPYFNGTLGTTVSSTSATPNTTALTALRNNTGYSTDRLAVLYSGANLTDQQVTDWHAALNTFLTAIGGA